MPLRILIVADDPLARAGLASLLGDQGAVVVGRAASAEVSAAMDGVDPDVIVWDLGQGLEAVEHLAAVEGSTPVVALVVDEADAADILAAGARGVLPRDGDPRTLQAALQGVASGLLVLDPGLSSRLPPARERDAAEPAEPLTPRELEVLQLLAEGLSNKQIAQRLGVSEHTAKFHVNAILSKLDAHSRTEAVTRAARQGLIIL